MQIVEKLLTPNKYSRPQTKLKSVKGIVIHWVANTNSSAIANRNFFENKKNGKSDFGSAHYIIGLDGEIIQCIPNDEIAYHVGSDTYTKEALNKLSSYPNDCTLGIECTHIKDSGEMSKETYISLIKLVVYLCKQFNLNETNLWLHYEVVGWKNCHRWFVDNPDEWSKFKMDIKKELNNDELSNWAKIPMKWAVEIGLTDGSNPKDTLTLERFITILYRYHQKY